MPQQLLRDPGITPTDKIIAQGLGKTNETYVAFIEQLKTHGITLMKWRYYNDGKAWLTISRGEKREGEIKYEYRYRR